MPDPTPKPPRVPLGNALAWSNDDIDRMSKISDVDVALAKRWWRKHSLPRYRKLLDAKPTEKEE